jgi:hypothetical protein
MRGAGSGVSLRLSLHRAFSFRSSREGDSHNLAHVFLLDQRYDLMASDQEARATMPAVAASEISEVVVWFRRRVRSI